MSRKEKDKEMIKIFVRHKVVDFAKWKVLFDGHEEVRKKFGAKKSEVFVKYQNTNDILAVMEWENKAKAVEFLEKSNLKEIMEEGGVLGAPEVSFSE